MVYNLFWTKGVNVMRKITALILAVLMLTAFSACKKKDDKGTDVQSDGGASTTTSASAADALKSATQDGKSSTDGGESATFVAPEFTVGSGAKTAKAGEEITIPLEVSAGSTIAVIDLTVSYDTDKLEYIDFAANEDSFLSADNEPEKGTIRIAMMSSTAKSISDAVELGKLTFKPKAGASGETKLNISCPSCCDENSNELHPTFNDPVITIG